MASGEIFGWEIPNLVVKEIKGEGKYYAFARMLLSGTVIPAFKILSQKGWLNYAVSNIRPDNLQEKVQRLVMALRTNDVTSKDKLVECVRNNPHFLEKELRHWLNVKNYEAVFQSLKSAIVKPGSGGENE